MKTSFLYTSLLWQLLWDMLQPQKHRAAWRRLSSLCRSAQKRSEVPPLKWSSLRYDFAMKEYNNGEEETPSGRDPFRSCGRLKFVSPGSAGRGCALTK